MAGLTRSRTSGVLLHVTSLPGAYGVGDLGSAARAFADFLARAGQRWWQILPLNPTSSFLGSSPYSSYSLFAGNPLLVSPERLAGDGWLRLADVGQGAPGHEGPVDFPAAERYKTALLERAFEAAAPRLDRHQGFADFVTAHGPAWLDDFAAFCVLKQRFGGRSWDAWPEDCRHRDPAALDALRRDEARALTAVMFTQYLFFSQWAELRAYCAERGVGVVGDLPFYPTFDSADVWAHPECFQLDEAGRAAVVAGVPPDYFSKTGQRWGNPVYDWPTHAEDGYAWWLARLAHNLAWADVVRLDHFRAFAAYWVVPPHEDTAENGWWVEGPGRAFFEAVRARLPELPFIAEDLGDITPDVVELRKAFGLPGMRVLQFGLGADAGASVNALHNHSRDSVAYTGTHDNNTSLGWFLDDLGQYGRDQLADYLGFMPTAEALPWTMIRLALMSPARTAVVPAQDLLGLDSRARMNTPAVPSGNWAWRMSPRDLSPRLADRLRRLCALYGRA